MRMTRREGAFWGRNAATEKGWGAGSSVGDGLPSRGVGDNRWWCRIDGPDSPITQGNVASVIKVNPLELETQK